MADGRFCLYWSPQTGALAPQVALEEVGAAYDLILVDTEKGEQRAPDYLALNPMGQVPTLALPDGAIVTESAAMLLHIADCFPDAGLLPAPGEADRARAYRWLLFMATGFYETDLHFYYPDRYTSDPEGADGVRAAALERFERLAGIVEAALEPGPYLFGARYSLLDAYLLMLAEWHPERFAWLTAFPRIARLCEAVRARPAVERVWRQHFPED